MCVDLFVMSMMPRALDVKFQSFINFIFNFYITYTHYPLREIRVVVYLGKPTAAARAALPIPTAPVCALCSCV